MKRLVACGAALLLVAAVASAQKDKDGGKQPPKDKDGGKQTKDKDGGKAPAKVEEPKPIVALRNLGAVIETDEKKAYVGVNLFGTKISDADLANLAGLKTLKTLDL